MPLANINGNEINYKDTGGDKPAIIFSHGFFMNLSSFDPQLEILKDKYRCISWDERGKVCSVRHLPAMEQPDAYTHLTLPTIYTAYTPEEGVTIKKRNKRGS